MSASHASGQRSRANASPSADTPAQAPAPAAAREPSTGEPSAPKPRRGYAGRTAEQLQRERRERLLEAALDLFGTRGYAASPIEAVCAKARVTTRHFYEAFDGREALLLALHEKISSETRRSVGAALAQTPGSIETRLRAGVEAFVHRYTDDPRRARVVFVEIASLHLGHAALRRGLVDEFASVLGRFAQALAGSQPLAPVNYRLGAMLMIGGTSELIVDWLNSSPRAAPETLVGQLVGYIGLLFSYARDLRA